MEALRDAIRLNYNANLEYANKAIQNYSRISPTEAQKSTQQVKSADQFSQQFMSDQTQKVSATTTDNRDKLEVTQNVSSYSAIAPLAVQMMNSIVSYSSTGKLINDKQTLGFNIKI